LRGVEHIGYKVKEGKEEKQEKNLNLFAVLPMLFLLSTDILRGNRIDGNFE